MSSCAGAEGEQSQTDSPSWPMEIFHTIDVMLRLWIRVGWGAGILCFLLQWVRIVSFLGVWTFLGVRLFSRVLWNLQNPEFLDCTNCCSGTGCKLVTGWWENWIVYSLFHIFIISSSVSISFVVLNCLYLNPWVSSFVHFSSPSCWGVKGAVSEWLLGPSSQLLT